MVFWTYILHCNGGYFYTGHTDDLERRMAEHIAGNVAGFVKDHWPAKLVWCSDFASRYEALSAERQIKGWSRAKKLALIRGDWNRISALAKGKGRASTSSARTEEGDCKIPAKPVSVFLHPHPGHLPSELFSLEAVVRRTRERLRLRYRLTGPLDIVCLPDAGESVRGDELWRRTCFEAFIQSRDRTRYCEFNFAPSTEWAAYLFSSYRADMEPLATEPPRLRVRANRFELLLTAEFASPFPGEKLRLNLSAVIEETDGTKSYWALAHPPSGPPDFHHPDCFVLELPASPRP